MKKVLTILVVLTLVAGFAFADGNSVTLVTSLEKISPTFTLYVEDGGEFVTTDKEVALDAVGGVTAQFKVEQSSAARVENNAEATLTVTCGAFYLYDGQTKVEAVHTALPTITAAANVAAGERTKLSYADGSAVPVNNAVTFKPKYAGYVATGDIGTLTANWVQRTDLPAGDYKADVTLSYTAL